MEIDKEEMYRKLGAYFGLWFTVRNGMEDSLTHDVLTDQERFQKLGGIETINAMLSDLNAVFPYPEQEQPIYQNWETA
jgi:hypothetical protein